MIWLVLVLVLMAIFIITGALVFSLYACFKIGDESDKGGD